MIALEPLKARLDALMPDQVVEWIPNEAPGGTPSFLIPSNHALVIARFLRDTPDLRLDYASNVTGVDWLDRMEKTRVKVRRVVEGIEQEVEEVSEMKRSGYLEAIYHLYSMELKQGPLVLRLRTRNRSEGAVLPSLTPVWRSCEFQEREVYDLYGIRFEGHPDLRRLLMWEGFQHHPMRKDYVEPDDYEYEPTPHDEVLARARDRSHSPT